ncbi:hypothetical protein [Zoogloea sp.]|uniref:hypothetical protein n=1 Tax=Zoogloea sp. TaxID=49181 RepID=UPI00261D97E1|nr:hypothetical protein [Zoogloea sp.]
MMRGLLGLCLLVCVPLSAVAQEINFADLQRPGSGLSRSATVPGLGKEGASFISRFSEVDSGRLEDLRRSRAAAASSSSYSSSGSSSSQSSKSSASSAPKNKTFVCSIYCNSSSGPLITREFSGPDRAAVARMIDDNAHTICRNSGMSRASSSSFDPSQCREK